MSSEAPNIWTGYFAKCGSHPRGLSIARMTPKWSKVQKADLRLAPRSDMLHMDHKGYMREYRKILANLKAERIVKEMDDKILLCYEAKGKWCHRHVVSKWIYDETGIIVHEFSFSGPVQVDVSLWWDPANPTELMDQPPVEKPETPESSSAKPAVPAETQPNLF